MWERIKHSLPVHVLLFTLAGIAVTGAVSMVRSALAVREEEAAARRRIADLAAQKVGLEERLNEYETAEGVRREAKARLNLKNPGEKIVVVLPDETASDTLKNPPSGWSRIFQSIGKFFGR